MAIIHLEMPSIVTLDIKALGANCIIVRYIMRSLSAALL
jgi:hypothetical protein